MDYRYETNDNARDFHKSRMAFIIFDNCVEFLPHGSSMSHFEYCQTKNISKSEFNNIIRGYYLNDNLVFYKDNFIYDDALIIESLIHIKTIAKVLNKRKFNIYFGELPQENFKLDFFYGKFDNGKIIKNI